MNERHALIVELLCLANQLSRQIGAVCPECTEEILSGGNKRILAYLAARENDPVYQRDIESAFSIRRSTVSKVITLMEEKGLIERERCQQDARMKRLTLTEKGRSLCRDVVEAIDDIEHRATFSFTEEQIRTLREQLSQMGMNLR